MRNWYEMYVYGRDKASGLASLSRSARMAREAEAARENRPAESTVVRLDRGKDADRAGATFVLQRNEVISIRTRRRAHLVSCVAGRVWTTVDGNTEDSLLSAGETMTYRTGETIVVQALRTATVRIECHRTARVIVGAPMRPAFQLG
jgi:hypothetical protein